MNKKFRPTTLYIKTHNKTGLKYFGQTTAKDPIKYKGSGTRWNNHIKKHGNDVTTEIVGVFEDKTWCMFYALEFSQLNDIVASNDWANLKTESLDGGFSFIDANGNFDKAIHNKGREKRKLLGSSVEFDREARAKGRQITIDKQIGYMNPENRAKGVAAALTEDSREKRLAAFKENKHQSGAKNSMFGTMWITNGILSKRINKQEPIPVFWYKGRVVNLVGAVGLEPTSSATQTQ